MNAMSARDWQVIITEQMREVERQSPIHPEVCNWARWGMGRNFESPFLARPAIWSLPGEVDKDMDPDAVPVSPPPPVNEKTARELDSVICDSENFPAIWRKVLAIHYLPPKKRNGRFGLNPVPEWQRPIFARTTAEGYISYLRDALAFLSAR